MNVITEPVLAPYSRRSSILLLILNHKILVNPCTLETLILASKKCHTFEFIREIS